MVVVNVSLYVTLWVDFNASHYKRLQRAGVVGCSYWQKKKTDKQTKYEKTRENKSSVKSAVRWLGVWVSVCGFNANFFHYLFKTGFFP